MVQGLKEMRLLTSFSIYISASLLMLFQTHIVIPCLVVQTGQEAILFWFIVGGVGIFLPLVILAFFLLKKEGYRFSLATWSERMRFKKMYKRDWIWCIAAIVATMLCSFAIMQILELIYGKFETSPSFMQFIPFSVSGKYWFFLLWLPYWILNILGEEILWRGVMQPRQEKAFGSKTWLIQSIGWTMFHLAFGWKLLLILLPLMFIQPYVVQKTKNSWTGVVIHGVVNGPSFIAIALGLI